MSVYVDDAFVGVDWGKWTGGGHMQADTLDELHGFANTQVAHPSCNVRKGASLAFMSTAPTSSDLPSATTCSTESGAES